MRELPTIDPEKFRARILANSDPSPDGCRIWRGSKVKGYPVVSVKSKRSDYVRRLGYETLVGPIPKGMKVAATCGKRDCVELDHWILRTAREVQIARS